MSEDRRRFVRPRGEIVGYCDANDYAPGETLYWCIDCVPAGVKSEATEIRAGAIDHSAEAVCDGCGWDLRDGATP